MIAKQDARQLLVIMLHGDSMLVCICVRTLQECKHTYCSVVCTYAVHYAVEPKKGEHALATMESLTERQQRLGRLRVQ